jgi:putative methionine-R-sulfoxide reductase with GAF domain
MVDKDNQSLIPRATSGFYENERITTKLRMHIGNGAAGQVLRDGITINITDINTDPRFLQTEIRPAYRSLLVAPVQVGGTQLGTISVESEKAEAFSEHEAELQRNVGNQADCVENARLFSHQRLKEVNPLKSAKLAAS